MLKGKPQSAVKQKKKHRPKFRTEEDRKLSTGEGKCFSESSFFILSEVASSKSQTGFLSLPVVTNNGSILYLILYDVKNPASELCDGFCQGLFVCSLN